MMLSAMCRALNRSVQKSPGLARQLSKKAAFESYSLEVWNPPLPFRRVLDVAKVGDGLLQVQDYYTFTNLVRVVDHGDSNAIFRNVCGAGVELDKGVVWALAGSTLHKYSLRVPGREQSNPFFSYKPILRSNSFRPGDITPVGYPKNKFPQHVVEGNVFTAGRLPRPQSFVHNVVRSLDDSSIDVNLELTTTVKTQVCYSSNGPVPLSITVENPHSAGLIPVRSGASDLLFIAKADAVHFYEPRPFGLTFLASLKENVVNTEVDDALKVTCSSPEHPSKIHCIELTEQDIRNMAANGG